MSDIRPEDLNSLIAALSQGDQRGAAVNSATTGFNTGRNQALEERKLAFQQKIQAAGLVPGKNVAAAAPELGLPTDRDYTDQTLTSILSTKKTEAEKAAALQASGAEKAAALDDKKAHMIPAGQSPTGAPIYPDAYNALKEKKASDAKGTETKAKLAFYAGMAANSAPVLDAADKEGFGQGQGTTLDISLPERWKSEKRKSFETAARQFATAILRPETGAQANEGEIKDTQKRFIVQAGDTPQVAAQKQASRKVAMGLLQKIAAGDTNATAQLDQMIGRANQSSGNPATGAFGAPASPAAAPAPQAGAPSAPTVVYKRNAQGKLERVQ